MSYLNVGGFSCGRLAVPEVKGASAKQVSPLSEKAIFFEGELDGTNCGEDGGGKSGQRAADLARLPSPADDRIRHKVFR